MLAEAKQTGELVQGAWQNFVPGNHKKNMPLDGPSQGRTYILVFGNLYQTTVGDSKDPCPVTRGTFWSRFRYMYNVWVAKPAVFLDSVTLIQVVGIIG